MSDYDDSWQSESLKSDTAVGLHLPTGATAAATGPGLTDEEARRWLAQPVPPRTGDRTMIGEGVSNA